MRLRLRIERNQLPAVTTLWPVKDTQFKHTVAQLLEQINGTFPLEGDDWGLEHYAVTIGGYECLHYHELGAVCKDEDEVVIRPLQYAETRARTLTGRDQISADGRHLVDGLPFGRPLLRGIARPEVRIPPRKRRRLEEPSVGVEQNAMALVRIEDEDNELDEEDSEEDDDDFEMEEDAAEESEASPSEEESESSDSESDSDSDTSDTSESSDSESDDDESASEESWDGIESAPTTPPSKKAAAKTELGARMDLSQPPTQSHAPPPADPPLKPSDSGSYSKRKAPADEGAEEGDVEVPVKKVKGSPQDTVLPYQGKGQTKVRNARKRDSKRLQHLKKVGVLPPDASITTLREWEQSNKGKAPNPQATEDEELADADEGVAAGTDEQAAGITEKDTSTETLDHLSAAEDRSTPKPAEGDQKRGVETKGDKKARLEKQRQELLRAIAAGGVDVTAKGAKRKLADVDVEDHEAPDEMSTKQPVPNGETNAGAQAQYDEVVEKPTRAAAVTKALDMVPAAVTRRSKLDLAGSKRLLYGSLGVRVPKTQGEKDALQKKLSDRAKQRIAPPTEAPAPPNTATEATADGEQSQIQDGEDDESWRDKLELTAVECCEENVKLSTPPFPFYQRWDPQQRRGKSKGRNGKAYVTQQGKRRVKKGGAVNGELVETYDKYNTDGNGDALDYDDAEDDEDYWEEGALLDEGYEDDDAGDEHESDGHADQKVDDGFPLLPADTTTLPLLNESEAQKNDYIVYTELTCSAATNWQPSMLTRTAQLQGKDEDGWAIRLALRDMRPKEYDDQGKRIYTKFEMEGMSDDEGEGEGRERTVQWAELVEPRLLLRPETAKDGEAAGSETLVAG